MLEVTKANHGVVNYHKSDAGGSRDRTTAKEPVVRGRKKATRALDREKNIPNCRGKSEEPKEHSQQQAIQEHSQQIHSATNVHNQKTRTTVFDNVQ